MAKTKLLILQYELSAYNVPCFNILTEFYDVTVGFYLKDNSGEDCRFRKSKLDVIKIGPFFFVKKLRSIAKEYDIVVFVPNPHVISYVSLPFLPHKYKLISWSIGFRCSYVHPYDTTRKHGIADWFYKKMYQKTDANVFYMEKAKEFWHGCNLDMSRVFVAPNTTDVMSIVVNPERKKNLLFVGTLYKGKGLDKLLSSYKEAVDHGYNSINLTIVGDGECRKELEKYVIDNNLSDKVTFTGAVFDEKELSKHFAEALLCISPTQGGLTCPKSMGYGVPFVTRKDAITGGEIYHITSGVNGILYDEDKELTCIIEDACDNPDKYVQMGIAAKNYYDNNATIKHMAQGAIDACNFVLNN